MEIRPEAYQTYRLLQQKKAHKKEQERITRQDLVAHVSNNIERIRRRIHG
jgi:hypothetical protein